MEASCLRSERKKMSTTSDIISIMLFLLKRKMKLSQTSNLQGCPIVVVVGIMETVVEHKLPPAQRHP